MTRSRITKIAAVILGILTLALPGRALPQQTQDIFRGTGTTGPFPLSWKPITLGSETVQVNSVPQTRNIDYTVDPNAGTITFTQPLPANAAAEISYVYDSTVAQRNGAGFAIPLSLALAQSEQGSLSLSALYKQPDTSGVSDPLTLGLGANWHGANSATLTTNLLFDPSVSAATPGPSQAQTPEGMQRMGVSVSGGMNAGQLARFSFGFAHAGLGFGNASDNGLQAGMQTLNLGGHFTPSRQVQADLGYTQSDTLIPTGSAATFGTSLGLTVLPGANTQIKAAVAQNTTTGQGMTQTQSLSVSGKPNAITQVNASLSNTDAPGQSNDSQAMNLATAVTASKTVSVNVNAGQSRLGSATVNQQGAALALTPRPNLQLSTSVGLRQDAQFSTVTTGVGAAYQPASFLQFSGSYKNRNAPAADTNPADTLTTSAAQVTLLPHKSVKLTGTYAQNPDDSGSPQPLAQRGLGLQTTFGAVSLSGNYGWTRQYETPNVGTTLNVGLGLRFSPALMVNGGYTQSLTGLGVASQATNLYTFGLTHNLGDRWNFSLNGTMQQQAGANSATPSDYTASANLGMKF